MVAARHLAFVVTKAHRSANERGESPQMEYRTGSALANNLDAPSWLRKRSAAGSKPRATSTIAEVMLCKTLRSTESAHIPYVREQNTRGTLPLIKLVHA